jgi:Xylose isomerase-like TIM barrel
VKVLHLNDSKKALGSHGDRHEHIGQGFVGIDAFRRLVNDQRFRGLPMLLETPKTEGRPPGVVAVDPLDERNLNTLRGLIVRLPSGTSRVNGPRDTELRDGEGEPAGFASRLPRPKTF